MNFRVFASGMLMILVHQLAIAAVVIWFLANCETAAGAGRAEAATPTPMGVGE